MSFISFNYWHPTKLAWTPCTWNMDRIERIEPDSGNALRSYLWPIGQVYPPLWTDIAWATAAVAFGADPPGTLPTDAPVAT